MRKLILRIIYLGNTSLSDNVSGIQNANHT